MKPQFSTSTLLLATAFSAISCGAIGITAKWNFENPGVGWAWLIRGTCFFAPCWLPFVFLAFAVARRTLTWQLIVLFAIAELAAVAYLFGVLDHLI